MLLLAFAPALRAHDHTLHKFEEARRAALVKAARATVDARADPVLCNLTIRLEDARAQSSLPGLVRIHDLHNDKPLRLVELIDRAEGWHAMPAGANVMVPRRRLRIEALRGLEAELASQEVDLTGRATASVTLRLKRFYESAARGWRAGNTHLHLNKLTRDEALRYLSVVTGADDLDLLFVSYLRRLNDDKDYITNSLTAEDLARLSDETALFANGEEHRHNFGGYGEGYGHVMFLLIKRLIEPVSIGPGIMGSGTDGIPLQRGIRQAHRDGATVIWCHNNFGLEDIPNWISRQLHAQNIFDGGSHGDYSQTFYRYLNVGLKVPFSTGTDWFIYDFSRAYVPVSGRFSARQWLRQLSRGKSFITNGPLLEFTAGGRGIGDTLSLKSPAAVTVRGRALGRADFSGLELVHNGEVIRAERASRRDGHFEAELQFSVNLREPGWLCLRVPLTAGKNELGQPLFAHTSPIYVAFSGKGIFRTDVADQLLREMQESVEMIKSKGKFAGSEEEAEVLGVYRRGIKTLQDMSATAGRGR